MAAARPPQQSRDDGPSQADRGEHDEGEMASYEVGAGVPSADDAARRPFLRAVLSDGTRTLLDEEGDREVVVHDRFARLDAGLPPLPAPNDDADAENLSPAPFVHRPSAPPARPAAAERAAGESSPAERPEGEPSFAERSGDQAGRSSWQHLAPPPPRPVVLSRPTPAEEPATPAEPAPPAVAATRIVPDPEPPPRDREPRSVVSFFAEDDEDDEPRSVDFESAADQLTEPVTDRYAPSNAEDEDDEPQPTATRFDATASDDEDDDAPPPKPNPPWRRSIFRAFSG
ncbi:hypothetical protein [Alienimonas californiensis]|uniref:Uncharacterized protein n=1 Tax=Alienimonas californiensis TaxID=2527989 RepID=A0A517PFR1_9PLAN|nr:hypothetical protein [Alienimonas californiensis]QDT18184.1 hypothetical protein CA12_43250 [Alienimonas californiensis]